MRHFSCDLCGKDLTDGADTRYVVRLEVFPAAETGELTGTEVSEDHVAAMAEMLDELERADAPADGPEAGCRQEYDLCPACRRRLLSDPLGRDSARKYRFSKN